MDMAENGDNRVSVRKKNPLSPSPGQSRGYALANARREQRERNIKILEMWKNGLTTGQIPTALETQGYKKISRSMVDKIIKKALTEAAESRRHLAEEIFDGELERLTTIIRHGWAIINASCLECQGQGQFRNGEVCIRCMGEGKRHPADTRIKAMKEVRAAIDQRAKMLGLYSPEKLAFTDASGKDMNFHPYLDQLSDDELQKALDDFSAGVEAARSLGNVGT